MERVEVAFKSFHDPQNKIVYKVDEPSITENKDRKGNRSGWFIHTQVHITRADNVLTNNLWKYKTSDTRFEHFNRKYSREDVIMYFMGRVYPQNCLEISSEEYEILQGQYETAAKKNRPT